MEKKIPDFRVGDTIRVHFKYFEGDNEKHGVFEGVVLAIRGKNESKTFTVRKISYGIGVERIFPLYSPLITKIEIKKRAKVRRAKLYYLRERKSLKLKRERTVTKEEIKEPAEVNNKEEKKEN
ncbi:MAG: 50S ribosomal protein L19 [candidate division WOR-3 bacterium]|nr:50S ribosomal protein L19 [candidate division WOR-3 bacterium]MCX7837203.1 50S ribosomal protein L19 [candidate division WOR-3 bacterium]